MDQFIHIRSSAFPVLPGEQEELVNEGMYGKALGLYLQQQLSSREYNSPGIFNEDWGWWVDLTDAPFAFGVCIYCWSEQNGPMDFACSVGVTAGRRWSWRKLRFIDTTPWVEKLHADLLAIFEADEDVEIVGVTADFPF